MNSSGADYNEVTDQMIMDRIYVLRGQKVMIDADLALLYQIETRKLRIVARKCPERFPADFMFQLSPAEIHSLQKQDMRVFRKVINKSPTLAFTEQGLAMLSGLVKSERSIVVNIRIIRIFNLIRQILPDYPELSKMLDDYRQKLNP